jgi:hypothetical protein
VVSPFFVMGSAPLLETLYVLNRPWDPVARDRDSVRIPAEPHSVPAASLLLNGGGLAGRGDGSLTSVRIRVQPRKQDSTTGAPGDRREAEGASPLR